MISGIYVQFQPDTTKSSHREKKKRFSTTKKFIFQPAMLSQFQGGCTCLQIFFKLCRVHKIMVCDSSPSKNTNKKSSKQLIILMKLCFFSVMERHNFEEDVRFARSAQPWALSNVSTQRMFGIFVCFSQGQDAKILTQPMVKL